jgi:putative hydrolase of the HAD superfamily
MPDSTVRLVVFDAGGVIVRVTGPWAVAQARAGIAPTELQAAPEFEAAIADLAGRHQRGELETALYFDLVARASGLEAGQVESILDNWIADEYPGWDRVVERLAQSGVESALLSNTNAYHWQYLVPDGAKAGRYPAIAHLGRHFASHELGAEKPDPGIYQSVEDATGRAPAEILFFDDLPENVAAARARGWQAVLIDPEGDPVGQILQTLESVGL